jgi:hypothetical protein
MNEFALHRLGMLMEPEPGNPQEVEGVLNPAFGGEGQLFAHRHRPCAVQRRR